MQEIPKKEGNLKKDLRYVYKNTAKTIKKVNGCTNSKIRKITKNNEFKGMLTLTGGVVIGSIGIGSVIGGLAILKVSLFAVSSGYLITKGVKYLSKIK